MRRTGFRSVCFRVATLATLACAPVPLSAQVTVQSPQPGTYDVSFEAAGFKRFTAKGLLLKVGDVLPMDAVLDIGSVTEQVEVKGQGAVLETETSSTSTVTEGDFLYKMPLYQRYVLNTLNFTPGVTMNGYAYGGSLGGFNVAGLRPTGTTVFEDGVFGNDPQSSTGTDIKPVENSVEVSCCASASKARTTPMHKTITFLFLVSTANAEVAILTREGERFEDGRPKVSDTLVK